MTEILDVFYDESGEVTQFLILEDGEPETKIASPENMLLYDPDDELPFDGGMADFFDGNSAIRISDNPEVLVSKSMDAYSYIISIDGSQVETTPRRAEDVLRAVYTVLTDGDLGPLRSVYRDILSSQVRRQLVGVLKKTFPESERISIVEEGWLVDSFYLVDWNANLYYGNEDPDENDYTVSKSSIKKDKSYEFVRISKSFDVDEISLTIAGDEYILTEREMLFFAKVTWLLNRRHFHPDEEFWEYTDRWADMEQEEVNLDKFSL